MKLRAIARKAKKGYLARQASKISAEDIRIIDITQDAVTINGILANMKEPFVGFADPQATYPADYFLQLVQAMVQDGKADSAVGKLLNHKGNLVACFGDLDRECLRLDAEDLFIQMNLHPCGAVYRMSRIRKANLCFDETLQYCRDELFATQFTEVAPVSLRLNKLKYKTALILDESSDSTPQSYNLAWYYDAGLRLVEKMEKRGTLSQVAQLTLLYLTMQRFKSNQGLKIKMVFENQEQCSQYLEEVGTVMRRISDDVLSVRTEPLNWERYKKIYLAQLQNPQEPLEWDVRCTQKNAKLFRKNSEATYEFCKLSDLKFDVVTMHCCRNKEGVLGIDLKIRLMHCFPSDCFHIIFVREDQESAEAYEAELLTEVAGIVTFFDRDAARRDAYHVFVPIEASKNTSIRAEIRFGEHGYRKKILFAKKWQNKLSQKVGNYWYVEHMILRTEKGELRLMPATDEDRRQAEREYQELLQKRIDSLEENTKEKGELKQALRLRKLYWETLSEYKGRRIWLYTDKTYKAGDNGEYALRYAAKQEDGIEKVFFLSPGSEFQRLQSMGFTVLERGSDEGILAALHGEVIYMTHVPPYERFGIPYRVLKYLKDLLNPKVIRLYHGFPITRSESYAQMAYDAAAVAIGSVYERNLYTNQENCFKPKQVIESGMPRYDDLLDDSQRQLLFAPTWRPSLTIGYGPDGRPRYNKEYRNSVYYQRYDQILRNEKLLATAKRTGYKIKFFLHPTMSAQTVDHESGELVQSLSCTEDMDYVTIMRQSDLMVTDFSSVQYDFAYMRKPVVYFHDPRLPYWRITNFDYKNIGFGEICQSVEQLVDVLCDYMEHDCELKPQYEKRIDEFFIHKDYNAAKRLYEATLELVGK